MWTCTKPAGAYLVLLPNTRIGLILLSIIVLNKGTI